MEKSSKLQTNPFIEDRLNPAWSKLSPDALIGGIHEALKDAEDHIARVASQDLDKVTYDSTLVALEKGLEPLSRGWRRAGHLDSVRNQPDFRAAYNQLVGPVSEFHARLYLNEDLWKAIKAFAESDQVSQLSELQKRHLQETLEDFREAGADLSPPQKKRLEKIASELAALTQKFSENVLDGINAWEWTTKDKLDLKGMPESAVEEARQSALDKGLGSEEDPVYRITLQAPSCSAVLTYAEDDALRQRVWKAFNSVGYEEPYLNIDLIPQILRLRHEQAQLLGFEDFSDLTTKRRMVGSGKNALGFVEDLHKKILQRFQAEGEELEIFKAEKTNSDQAPLEPWEAAYWREKLRQAQFGFDEEELRPYFPIQKVMSGLYQLVETLFQIQVTELPTWSIDAKGEKVGDFQNPDAWEVWHPDVKAYEMKDSDGRLMGYFYADWHPREEKRGGAWMNNLRSGERGLSQTPHLGVICGNMSKPTSKRPALLKMREVETIFHEFGHLLHGLCGEVPIKALNGLSVPWDFVELPSQIMENWCWYEESLSLFSGHYESGEAIPTELLDKMKKSRNFAKAVATMRQLVFGKMDLELHRRPGLLDDSKNIQEVLQPILADYMPNFASKAPINAPSFTHIFGDPLGYAAGYYSYKWAEVLEADAFARFEQEGILNPKIGRAFRDEVLSVGNSRPVDESFRAFRGRDPEPDALLRRDGLL